MNISTLSYYLRLVSSHGIFLCPSPTVIHSVPPPSLSSVPILELNCFVRGDDASQVFSIEIANNNLVSALRDAIKDKNPTSFHNVDARSLHLWNVSIASIPVDARIKDNVNKRELRKEEELSPVETLTDVFSVVHSRKNLHVIVVCDAPTGECEYVVEFGLSVIVLFVP
jgi:hypothetical protein